MTLAPDRRRSYAARRRRLIAYGRWQPYVDPAPVREHIRALQAYGLSLDSIAVMAGEHPTALSVLMYPGSREYVAGIRQERANRYLALRFNLDAIPDDNRLDACGTRRRLEALGRMGWSGVALANRLGITEQALSKFRTHPTVTARVARRIRDLYDELWDQQGGASKAQKWAERHGWAPPLAWDDETIDDPRTQPYVGVDDRPHGEKITLDDIEDCASWGLDRRGAARRLGVEASTIEKRCAPDRGNRPDLLERLDRNALAREAS